MTMLDPVGRTDEGRAPQIARGLGNTARAALALVALLAAVTVLRDPRDLLAILLLAAVAALVVAAAAERVVLDRLAARRAQSGAGLARTLQQLSRSTSSDAIVDAVVEELRRTADADHVLVARLRPVERVVEAVVASTRARVPSSRTALPANVLNPERLGPALNSASTAPAQRVADEIARRLSGAYGLADTIAAPLVADGQLLGALVLSRRQQRDWNPADERLLEWSATELAVALARAFAFEEIENRANIDALTGLPNRRYLEELLATVGPRRRAIDRLGLLMVDLDHFKQLNDNYGHATGDAVLRAVAERLSNAVRADDTPARYGGEEFAVVLRRTTDEQAVEVAERIRAEVEAIPAADLGVREPVTVSIGVAVGDAGAADVQLLLQAADRALYQAKRAGRNRVAVAA